MRFSAISVAPCTTRVQGWYYTRFFSKYKQFFKNMENLLDAESAEPGTKLFGAGAGAKETKSAKLKVQSHS